MPVINGVHRFPHIQTVYDAKVGRNLDVNSINTNSISIAGTQIIDPSRIVKNLRVACISRGLSAVRVTETIETLKQELIPDTEFYWLTYIEGIRIVANNPPGSGATLYFRVRALLDNGTEADLSDVISVTAGSSFDDTLRFVYDAVPHGRTIRAIRLYAWVSAAVPAGSEPTVNIAHVTGLMI